jgi:hypothetical protein
MKMKWSKSLAGAVVAVALCTAASAAYATVINFEYTEGVSPVATGSFTYATGKTGVLGYTDLSAFSVTIGAVSYDLADVNTFTDYVYFGYDTSANDFVTNPSTCGFDGCGFASSLSAINSSGTDGFFFNPVPGVYTEYTTDASGPIDGLTISNATVGVPEPVTLSLFGVGFAGLAAMRRRKKAAQA